MSGPKSSRYTLTAEQRQFLMDQLAVRNDRAALQNALTELYQCSVYIREHAHRLGNADLHAMEAEIAFVKSLLAARVPTVPAELHAFRQQTHDRLHETLKTVSAAVSQQQAMKRQVADSIARDVVQGYSSTLDDLFVSQAAVKAEYGKRLQAIAASAITPATAEQARAAVRQLRNVTDDRLLQSFAAITILPLEQQHRRETALYEEERERYELLSHRHAALCGQLNLPASPAPWQPGAAEALEKQIADMEQTVYRHEEQAYIRQALDEVMVDMGYALLGEREVRKRSGARFHHALYTLGDGTAVDVTYDANGQIAMELGGLDDVDRLPDAEETASLCRSMEDFCTSFTEFEARLATRGVVLKDRISLLPPAEDYAQIINVQDYCAAGDMALFHETRVSGVQRSEQKYLTKE